MAGRGMCGFLWDAFLGFLIGWCCGTCLWSLKTKINELKKMSLKFFHVTSIHLYPFFETAFYQALAGSPGTHCVDQAGAKTQRSSCFCLPSAGIKGTDLCLYVRSGAVLDLIAAPDTAPLAWNQVVLTACSTVGGVLPCTPFSVAFISFPPECRCQMCVAVLKSYRLPFIP